jgi:hypothetical protein
MSNVSTTHDVIPFVAGKTAPLSDQRLAKVGYKNTTKNPAKYKNVAVSVPFVQDAAVTENLAALMPYIKNMVQDAQDKVIRSLYESADGALTQVTDSDISVSACISFLEAEAAGDRLKKEDIANWFDRVCRDNVYVLLAEKLGFQEPNEDQDKVINKHVGVYRDILSMLAGGKTILTPVQIKSCQTVIDASSDDTGIGEKLSARLRVMSQPKVTEDFLSLD